MRSSWAGDGSALPLPHFAGEGWGWGVLPQNALLEGIDFCSPAALLRRHSRSSASALSKRMRLGRVGPATGSALHLPLFAGEGWGGGASAKRAGRGDRLSPTRRALASAIAEAQLRRFPSG